MRRVSALVECFTLYLLTNAYRNVCTFRSHLYSYSYYSYALSTLSSHNFTFHLIIKTSTTRLGLLQKIKARETSNTSLLHTLVLLVP